MYVKGTMNSGGVITNETPIAEWDDTSVASKTFQRYETVTVGDQQYLECLDETGATTIMLVAYDTWANRATATYKPIN